MRYWFFRVPLLGTEVYAEVNPLNAQGQLWATKDDTGTLTVNIGSFRVILSPTLRRARG